MSQVSSERAQAALIGFAVGDAYGRELEFLSGIQVRTQRIRLDKNFNTSDETHMALYTAQAILKHEDFNIDQFGHALGEALINWTQDPRTAKSAPSKNCLKGVQNYLQHKEWRRSGIPQSDGSGSIMRICPISIAFSSPRLEQAAEISALITHSHPNALAAAVSCARLLRSTLENKEITAKMVLDEAILIEQEYQNAPSVPAALRAAVLQSNRNNIDWLDERSIPEGDGGWRAPSALGLALTAVLHFYDDPRTAIDKAARINGDSDGVAALTGMFLGAALGFESLPLDWVQALSEARDIAAFADSLCQRITKDHWLLEKCTALEKKGARFSVEGDTFYILVPQTSTAGILALRPIAEELGVGLEVKNGAVVLLFPTSKAPPSFVARYDKQSKVPKQPPPAPPLQKEKEENWEAAVIDEEEEEIWEAEVIEEEDSLSSTQQTSQNEGEKTEDQMKQSYSFNTQKDSSPYPNQQKNNKKTPRTSVSDPITVDWIQQLHITGSLGITFAPGKHASSAFGAPWKRDLQIDLDRLAGFYQIDTIFSLVEENELEFLNIPDLVTQAAKRRITVYRSPIVDTKTPTYSQAKHLVQIALPLLNSGKKIIFHCRGGLGRAGTLSACTLIGMGCTPQKAISEVRLYRKDAIENIYQEQFIFEFAQNWRME